MGAETGNGLDDVLQGFDTEDMDVVLVDRGQDIRDPVGNRGLELYGKFLVSGGWYAAGANTEYCKGNPGNLSELAAGIELNLKTSVPWGWNLIGKGTVSHDFAFRANGRAHYTSAYLSDAETQWELMELYVEKNVTPWLDIGVGRQITAWGTSETFRVVDVVNPLDRRQYGKTDIEDLRLGVAMIRLDAFVTNLHFSGLVIHEVRHDKRPECGSPFFTGTEPVGASTEDTGLGKVQFGARLAGQFQGWDASLYLANVFHNTAYQNTDGQYIYPRIWMVGGIWMAAFGSFLVKTEAAWFDGVRYSSVPEKTHTELKILVGVEYSGFTDTQLILEMMNTRISSFEPQMAQFPYNQQRNTLETVLRAERTFLNESLEVVVVGGFSGSDFKDGSFQRLEVSYDFTDRITATAGFILYNGGDAESHEAIKDNDILYVELERCFSN